MDWLWGALAGAAATAIFGALGFLFNLLILEPRTRARNAREREVSALKELQLLLQVSLEVFRTQNYQAQRLLNSIIKNHPEVPTAGLDGKDLGYDEVFHRSYSVLTQDETEIFVLIRGATMTTMHKVNADMKLWLESHAEFVHDTQPSQARTQLRDELVELRTHLNRWLEKFAGWMEDKTRSLVYMADEKGHGPEFPKFIDGAIGNVLRTLDGST